MPTAPPQPLLTPQQTLEVVSACARERVSVKLVPDVLQIMSTEVTTSDLTGLPLMRVRDVALHGWNLTLKRAVDITTYLKETYGIEPADGGVMMAGGGGGAAPVA